MKSKKTVSLLISLSAVIVTTSLQAGCNSPSVSTTANSQVKEILIEEEVVTEKAETTAQSEITETTELEEPISPIIISETKYLEIGDYSEEKYPVKNESGLWGYADCKGNIIIEPQYIDAKPFSNDLAAVKKDESSGYQFIDESNNIVIAGPFSDILPRYLKTNREKTQMSLHDIFTLGIYGFYNGEALVRVDNSWQIIDTAGNKMYDVENTIGNTPITSLCLEKRYDSGNVVLYNNSNTPNTVYSSYFTGLSEEYMPYTLLGTPTYGTKNVLVREYDHFGSYPLLLGENYEYVYSFNYPTEAIAGSLLFPAIKYNDLNIKTFKFYSLKLDKANI